ncbi:MAG: hypothetical protein KDA37_01350 [Planctomycetales bacterium]|nr:hypothetical protein [Planctomycetales bacterium]
MTGEARFRIILTTACVLGSLPLGQALSQPIPAFPGADGAAAYVAGGRGGIVYHVTKLDSAIDDGDRFDFGTLRYGLTNSNFPAGPRTIVFDVGGVFSLGRLPQAGWDPNGNGWDAQSRLTIGGTNVTLAGQTAPGAGVIFMGGGLKPQGDNNIIRNVTVASGYGMRNWWKPGDPYPAVPGPSDLGVGNFPDATVFDGMDIAGTNLMIDHVSTLFATDETISMNEVANNITVQYSNISQGLNYPQWDAEGGGYTGHALGSLLEAGAGAAISFHHNLYAHQKSRVPQAQGSSAYYDFRNNVFYNWLGSAGVSSGSTQMNLVGNFYLAGNGGDNPVGGNNTGLTTASGGTGVIVNSSVYKSGNLLDTNKDGDPNDGAITGGGDATPNWSGGVVTYAGTTENARDAFDTVLDYVGANWWTRDGVVNTPDERIINEARTGTGKIIAWADDPWNNDPNEGVEWRALVNTPQTNRAAGWDTESDIGYGVGDGMPTYWELEHGLDPNARDDAGDFDSDGYTNLEEYLNEIAAWPAPNAIVFNNAHADGRFAHILNWDANPDAGSVHPWQPSRFDTAVIDNGAVTVDAVGQHAGNVLLATGPGDNATLNITAGWLEVHAEAQGLSDGMLVIGDNPSATATLNLTGGALRVGALLKGPGGEFNLMGGVLSADTVGFDLVNDGGTIAPGSSVGVTQVLGHLTLNSGALAIELASPTEADLIEVTGALAMGGDLSVSLLDGFNPESGSWLIATAASFTGAFDSITPGFIISQQGNNLLLSIGAGLPGDFNGDGTVNAADYTVWRDGLGTQYQASDYQLWRDNYGATQGLVQRGQAAPEPSAIILCVLAASLSVRRSVTRG